MPIFLDYLWALSQNWWGFLTSGPCIAEATLKQYWPGYENWANKYVLAPKRQKASILLAISGVFVAGFMAFSDEHTKLQEAQKQIVTFQEMNTGKQQRITKLMGQFSKFSGRCNELMYSDIKLDQYPLWKRRLDDFKSEMVPWIETNMGLDAKERLLDMSVFTPGSFARPVDPDQHDKLIWLDKACHNLLRIMQDVSTGVAPPSQASPR